MEGSEHMVTSCANDGPHAMHDFTTYGARKGGDDASSCGDEAQLPSLEPIEERQTFSCISCGEVTSHGSGITHLPSTNLA